MKKKIETIEDIYPLTIIKMRYGENFIIFNRESDNSIIHDVQMDEEPFYNIHKYMEENVSPQCYGIGITISKAFEDYKERYYNEDTI